MLNLILRPLQNLQIFLKPYSEDFEIAKKIKVSHRNDGEIKSWGRCKIVIEQQQKGRIIILGGVPTQVLTKIYQNLYI